MNDARSRTLHCGSSRDLCVGYKMNPVAEKETALEVLRKKNAVSQTKKKRAHKTKQKRNLRPIIFGIEDWKGCFPPQTSSAFEEETPNCCSFKKKSQFPALSSHYFGLCLVSCV